MGIIDVWFDTDIDLSTEVAHITEANKIDIYIRDVLIPGLHDITVSGIENIKELIYTKEPSGNWYIESFGSNLYEVLALDIVDNTRTVSNNMWEIYEIFGIDATREFLIEEFMKVISSDASINRRHMSLLVDIMTYIGSISSISRYGVHRNQSGPLTKSSFEECLENLLKAGVYGDLEDTKGVSAAIMVGKPSNIGTGLCELLYKTD